MANMQSQIRSIIHDDLTLEVSLIHEAIPVPGPEEVLVEIQAAPINPSDLLLLLGPVDPGSIRIEEHAESPVVRGKIFEKALNWEGAIDKINWKNEKHKIIIGENDDNYELTKSIMKNKDNKVLCTLEGVNHKNTFNEPKHSLSAIINFLQDNR